MRRSAALCAVLAFTLFSCSRNSAGTVTHRGPDGRPDQWVYRTSPTEYRLAIDTNGDGQPDVIKTFKDGEVVQVESDRNFNGKVDLVQQYTNGVLVRETRDDDFDGRPETIRHFRPNGTLAIVERDPTERGAVDIVEYYDESGHLTRREFRRK
jgi:hypothetical protein